MSKVYVNDVVDSAWLVYERAVAPDTAVLTFEAPWFAVSGKSHLCAICEIFKHVQNVVSVRF